MTGNKEIAGFISELLFERDCVIVPSLGAFLTRRIASVYDKRRGVMMPPRKELAFNREILHTDGVLADHVSQKSGITYEEAVDAIDHFAKEVNEQVEKSGQYTLPGLGVLEKEGDVVVFTPESENNFLADSYGLGTVPVTEVGTNLTDLVSHPSAKKVIGTAAAVGLMLMISPKLTNDERTETANISSIFTETQRTAAVQEKTEEPESEVAAPIEDQHIAVEKRDGGVSGTKEVYYLIVASFKTVREADIFIEKQRVKGITDLSVLENGGRMRVVAARFSTQAEAVAANRDLRTITGFEKSWVLHLTE